MAETSLPLAQHLRDSDRDLAKRIAANVLRRIEEAEKVRRPGHPEVAFLLSPEAPAVWEGLTHPCEGLLRLVAEEVNKVTKPMGYLDFYFRWDPSNYKSPIEGHLPLRGAP